MSDTKPSVRDIRERLELRRRLAAGGGSMTDGDLRRAVDSSPDADIAALLERLDTLLAQHLDFRDKVTERHRQVWEALSDSALERRGNFTRCLHCKADTHTVGGTPFHRSDCLAVVLNAAPLLPPEAPEHKRPVPYTTPPDPTGLRGLLAKATGLPWGVSTDRPDDVVIWGTAPAGEPEAEAPLIANIGASRFGQVGVAFDIDQHNADLLVAAVNALPGLLERVEQAHTKQVALESELRELRRKA